MQHDQNEMMPYLSREQRIRQIRDYVPYFHKMSKSDLMFYYGVLDLPKNTQITKQQMVDALESQLIERLVENVRGNDTVIHEIWQDLKPKVPKKVIDNYVMLNWREKQIGETSPILQDILANAIGNINNSSGSGDSILSNERRNNNVLPLTWKSPSTMKTPNRVKKAPSISKKNPTPQTKKSPVKFREIETQKSYSFHEVPFYPRVKLLCESQKTKTVNNSKSKSSKIIKMDYIKFDIVLNEEQIRGIREQDYKIFLFCGVVPIIINLDSDDDEGNQSNTNLHEVLPISLPQTYQIINSLTDVCLEKSSMIQSKKKNKKELPIDITKTLEGNEDKLHVGKPLTIFFYYYASPNLQYYISVYLVETIKTPSIVEEIQSRPQILTNATIYSLKKSSQQLYDPDESILQATFISVPLDCPISGSRMTVPIKSKLCPHIECFDAYWYLESQRQVTNDRCPICSRTVPQSSLAVSEFINDILKSSPVNCHKIRLETTGKWEPIIDPHTDTDTDTGDSDQDDDDEAQITKPQNIILSDPAKEGSAIFSDNNNNGPVALDPNIQVGSITPTHDKIISSMTFSLEQNDHDSPQPNNIPNILGRTPLNGGNTRGALLPTTRTFKNLAAITGIDHVNNTPVGNIDTVGHQGGISFDTSMDNDNTTVLHKNFESVDMISTPSPSPASHKIIPEIKLPILPKLPVLPTRFVNYSPTSVQNMIENNKTSRKLSSTIPATKPVFVPFNANLVNNNMTNNSILPQKRQHSEAAPFINSNQSVSNEQQN